MVREFESTDSSSITRYIVVVNIRRGHLDPDQRVTIAAEAHEWIGKRNPIDRSTKGRRPVEDTKQTLLPNDIKDSGPKFRVQNARSTAGQIAAITHVGQNKASAAMHLTRGRIHLEL